MHCGHRRCTDGGVAWRIGQWLTGSDWQLLFLPGRNYFLSHWNYKEVEKVKGNVCIMEKDLQQKTVAVNTAPVQSIVRRVKWSTSLPLTRVWTESLTQAAPNSPITLLHRPALAPLSKPPRPIISTFSLPRPFLFSLDALRVPGKGRRQSIARLCRYRSVDGPCGNLRPARGEMFYRFVISRLTTLIPSCGEKLTEKSSFFNP